MSSDLCEAIEIKTRYFTKDRDGETRTERNIRFDSAEFNQDYEIPSEGEYLWDWFDELSSGINRVIDGAVQRATWGDLLAWSEVTGKIVMHEEYAILRDMDSAWVNAMQVELNEAREREQAKREAEAAAKQSSKRRRR